VIILSFNYSEPLFIEWFVNEQGEKVSEPVTNESKQVVVGKVILDYLPDFFYKVTSPSIELTTEIKINKPITLTTQYKVDYNSGFVYVHPDLEGNTLLFDYYKRGILKYPASRIVTKSEGGAIEALDKKLDNFDSAETTRVSSENTRISNENTRISDENTRIANEVARQLGYALMINESFIIYKEPVATFTDIATTYPTPVNGWATRVLDTFKTYRYNEGEGSWVWIDTITSGVYDNLATAPINGGNASSLFT
jgi:hypothetical protein